MAEKNKSKAQMAAATQPTTANRTGTWRFEKPVFVEQIAPCREACPVGEDIPGIMALNDTGAFEEAYGRILLENPFPGICGKLCFHPCEKVCNRGRLDQAVSIRDLEYFVSNTARESQLKIERPQSNRAPKAAMVGGGPAGLSCAYFLACLGYRVTILEMNPQLDIYMPARRGPGILLRHLEWEVGQVLSLGIDHYLNVRLSRNNIQGFAAQFDAIYISTGSERIVHSLLKNATDDMQTNRVTLPTGAKRIQTLMLSTVRGSDARVIYREPSPEAVATGPGKKDADLSKYIVREIAAGKFAAMVIDISFQNEALKSIRQFTSGRLGALSMESYRQRRVTNSSHRTEHVVRFSDLNTASFQKLNQIQPSQPDGRYSRRQAVRSARRCFKCGRCTFCKKCYDYCPDLSIYMDAKQKYREIDYDHCKGCGICAAECPRAAIDWVKE
jgi:2-oxoacid:acceptor oxidoreductase delta subunit (pyruvate/2-ketoisovalerate family)